MTEIEAFFRTEALLIVQVVFFLILTGGIIHLHYRLSAVLQQLTSERVDAILEVKHVADHLASRVATIAEKLQNTSAVIHHELTGKPEDTTTVRDQIDAIKHATDALVKNGEPNGKGGSGRR